MSKKERLKNTFSEEDMEFIESKKNIVSMKYNKDYKNIEKILDYKIGFKAKNEKQKEYHKKLMSEKNNIIFTTGEPGTGKSYVCLAAALQLLKEDNRYKKILLVCPTVEAGNMGLGYLKGDKQEKIMPYTEADLHTMTKILNNSGNDGETIVKKLVESNYILIDSIGFMRGKTLDDYIVIFTESENFSKQEMFLLLSRLGTSKYFFNGDNRQMDRKDIKQSKQLNGLEYAEKTLKDLEGIEFCHFNREDIVRHPLISKIMDRWFGEEY